VRSFDVRVRDLVRNGANRDTGAPSRTYGVKVPLCRRRERVGNEDAQTRDAALELLVLADIDDHWGEAKIV
jgi:hypothetical protein